jgi:hypothetical protein
MTIKMMVICPPTLCKNPLRFGSLCIIMAVVPGIIDIRRTAI